MSQHDFSTPEGRLRAIEALGPERYNAAITAAQHRDTVAVVNGYRIRPVSSRYGRIFMIDGAGCGYASRADAEAAAAKLPPNA